jgi:hypothetical protein
VQHPPYPATTRAGGFKFELDCERVVQSDTWALATPCQRPLLLMLWFIAWQQTPCGSLPKDDMLNAARLGMEAHAFQCDKAILLRGWIEADDGRLYHPVLTQLVLEMMDRKAGNAQRQAAYRRRRLAAHDSETNDKHHTNNAVTHYSGVSDDTTTTTTTTTTITNESIPNGISTVSTRKSAKALNVSDLVAEGVEQQDAEDWLTVRKAKRAPLTRAAWNDMKTEAAKAAISPAEAVRIAASSSWQGFKASWLSSSKNPSASTARRQSNGTHGGYENFDYGQGGAL